MNIIQFHFVIRYIDSIGFITSNDTPLGPVGGIGGDPRCAVPNALTNKTNGTETTKRNWRLREISGITVRTQEDPCIAKLSFEFEEVLDEKVDHLTPKLMQLAKIQGKVIQDFAEFENKVQYAKSNQDYLDVAEKMTRNIIAFDALTLGDIPNADEMKTLKKGSIQGIQTCLTVLENNRRRFMMEKSASEQNRGAKASGDKYAHLKPKIKVATIAMENMGYSNDSGILSNLLEKYDGDIGKVLDIVKPMKQQRSNSKPFESPTDCKSM